MMWNMAKVLSSEDDEENIAWMSYGEDKAINHSIHTKNIAIHKRLFQDDFDFLFYPVLVSGATKITLCKKN